MNNYKAYLRKQPTYDEITGYIHFGQDRITYPDRSATFLRDSPYLGIYDGMGTQELEEQEQQVEKAKLMDAKAREIARDENKTHIPPEPGKKEDPPPDKGKGKGKGNIPGGIPKGIKQPLPITLGGLTPVGTRADDPKGLNVNDDIEQWYDAKEQQDTAIAKATKQNEEKIHDEVNKKMLNRSLEAIKNTAGTIYRNSPDMETMQAVADASAKTAMIGGALAGAYLVSTAVVAAATAIGIYQTAVGIDKLISAIKKSEVHDEDTGGSTSSRNIAKEDKAIREKFKDAQPAQLKEEVLNNPEMKEFIEFLPDEEAKENVRLSVNRANKTGLIRLLANLATGTTRMMVL
jgi:hypothetical protein